ncbi:hypothetical protein [Otoolea muris]|uniref:hypothetical protein n=1 Tax=Otoolea muris TaxID=2941515 RepID=UPI002040A018|nr:hypothetical protein [Otoolea muris]
MGYPLDNLGDYNRARIDLQAKNGDLDALYKDVGDTAVADAAPGLMLKGGIIGSAVTILLGGISFLGYKGFQFMKKRREKLENEPALKEKFVEAVKAESSTSNTEEPIQDIQI